jgi:hypothetical protein
VPGAAPVVADQRVRSPRVPVQTTVTSGSGGASRIRRAASTARWRWPSFHRRGSWRRERTSSSRPAVDQEKGHCSIGSASWNARNPSPIAATARAGSGSSMALCPGSAAVTSHEPSSSAPTASTPRDRPVRRRPVRTGRLRPRIDLRRRPFHEAPARAPTASTVSPPSSFRHTGTTTSPEVSARTAAGNGTSGAGRWPITDRSCRTHRRPDEPDSSPQRAPNCRWRRAH